MKSFALHVGRGCVVAVCLLALFAVVAGSPVLAIVYAAGNDPADAIADHYKVEHGQLVTVGYIGGVRSEWATTDSELSGLGLVRIAPRHVTVYTRAGCESCERMKNAVGIGDSRVAVEWLPASKAPRDLPAYPAIYITDADAWEYGCRDIQGLHALLQRHQPALLNR